MKKVAVLSLASLFLLTGCGNKVKCKTEDGTYTGTIKGGYVVKLTATQKFDSKEEAKETCDMAKSVYGSKSVKCKSKSVSMTMDIPKSSKVTKADFKEEFCK